MSGYIDTGKVILYYDSGFYTFLKESLSENVEVLAWIEIDNINDTLEKCVERVYPIYNRGERIISCVMTIDRQVKDIVYQMFTAMNVSAEMILDVHKAYMAGYSVKRYQRMMERKADKPLDGIVLGISHGRDGIAEEYLPGNVCNLSSNSQDIYFNYKVLESLYEEYYVKIKDIKYVVFDMFDYFYFNFDTIQTGAMIRFVEANGFECEYREPWNKESDLETINQCVHSMWAEGKNQRSQTLFNQLFPYAGIKDKYVYRDLFSDNKYLSETAIDEYVKKPEAVNPQVKVYEPTIQRQIRYLDKIFELLFRINPDIKIYLLLMPKYFEVEKAEIPINQKWIPFFNNTVNNFKNKYNFELINLKDCTEISQNKEYYADLTHLNHEGAKVFTKYLAEILKEKGI